MGGVRRTRITARVDHDRGVFMISVAAELAEMHPQTLRMYETRGLIEPKRSPKGTRLYSQADVERLRRIQEMTTEWGMNLAGVERVFELEEQLDRMQRKVVDPREARRAARLGDRAARREARVRQGRDRALRGRAGDVVDPHPARQEVAEAHVPRGAGRALPERRTEGEGDGRSAPAACAQRLRSSAWHGRNGVPLSGKVRAPEIAWSGCGCFGRLHVRSTGLDHDRASDIGGMPAEFPYAQLSGHPPSSRVFVSARSAGGRRTSVALHEMSVARNSTESGTPTRPCHAEPRRRCSRCASPNSAPFPPRWPPFRTRHRAQRAET